MNPRVKQRSFIEDPDLFMAMEDLELAARGIVEGALHGAHRSPYLGFSVEFDSHREYQPGDDLRYVNWHLWGRTNRLYVKMFESTTNLNLYLMLDATGSMNCENGPSTKWRYCARAVAALSHLALNGRDAAGIYLLHDKLHAHVPPRVKPGQLHEILSVLHNAAPRSRANIARALGETYPLCKRRGIVMLFSDFFDSEEEIFAGMKYLRYMGHEVVAVQVLDPWEADLPEKGQYEFRDLETGETIRAVAPQLREAYAREVAAWQGDFRRKCEEAGVEWLSCRTADPLRDILIDYLLKRSRLH